MKLTDTFHDPGYIKVDGSSAAGKIVVSGSQTFEEVAQNSCNPVY